MTEDNRCCRAYPAAAQSCCDPLDQIFQPDGLEHCAALSNSDWHSRTEHEIRSTPALRIRRRVLSTWRDTLGVKQSQFSAEIPPCAGMVNWNHIHQRESSVIWITTLCLLALAAWLFFNALNERRWVEAQQYDEGAPTDPGLFPKYSQLNRTPMPEGGYSIWQSESSLARFASGVSAKTATLGNSIERMATSAFKEKSATQSAGRSRSELGNSLTDSDSLIGRTADMLSRKSVEIGTKIPVTMPRPKSQETDAAPSKATGPISGFIKTVTDHIEKIDNKSR